MKFLIIILSLILLNSCSTYDRIIDNAGDAYDWSKEKAKDTVEGVKEVISESIKILGMCDKNCKISMGIAMSNTKKFLTTNFSIEK